MSRVLAVLRAACWVAVCCAIAQPVRAQAWNDARARELVERATTRRAQQLADTALRDYHATAHGYLTFLAQVGENFPDPPKVVRSDELVLEAYWRAPNLSKQRIVGRRDTLALPTNIAYHQDHLGIVQNNFPSIIRIGEGDEVRDVPHPLSEAGNADYDFAIHDSLSIHLPDHSVQVYELRVRPKDPSQPRLVGALYIDRSTGDVVRMAFTFTRPAYLDKELEDISIVLENALVQGRFWLPLHQEVEIRRTGRWLDFPARGIIRGRWEISGYDINRGIPLALFAGGPEITSAPPRELALHPWHGRILDSLPSDVRAASDDDVRKVQEEARALVQQQALARAEGAALSARKVSDFARVNRVEGLALGAGVSLRAGAGVVTSLRARYGFDDHAVKGRVSVALRRGAGTGVELFGVRDYRDVGDIAERSTAINSFAAQEFGSDATDPYDVRGAGLAAELGTFGGLRWRIEGAWERQDSLRVHASPAWGRYERTIPAQPLHEERITIGFARQGATMLAGLETRFSGQLRVGLTQPLSGDDVHTDDSFGRLLITAHGERPLGDGRLVLEGTAAGMVTRHDAEPQELVYLGGPVSGPGYDYHQFAGRVGATARIEWRTHVPFVGLSLGPYGHAPASAMLAPFATVLYTANAPAFAATRPGWYPAVGIGALLFFDIVRIDVARGLRRGRWTFSLDVTRDLWPIL
ncbi:MAG: hypothetical protein JJD97_02705 [Gemmatimonadaceae bacterium]|nr:hypothetical protein [Gemmatimonadaceae bacterium]